MTVKLEPGETHNGEMLELVESRGPAAVSYATSLTASSPRTSLRGVVALQKAQTGTVSAVPQIHGLLDAAISLAGILLVAVFLPF